MLRTSPSTLTRHSETLATRLNELALANADGLLGDDEYRILRQTMFEQVASSSSAPAEPTYGRIPNGHDDRSGERGQLSVCLVRPSKVDLDRTAHHTACRTHTENLRTPTPGNYDASSSSRPASVHSTSSSRSKLSALGSMFRRRPSHSSNYDTSSNQQHSSSSSRRESSSGSLFSSTSSTANGRSSLLQVPGERSRNNSADSRFSSSNSQLGSSSIRSGRTGRSVLTEHTFNDPGRPASLFSTTSTRASASAPPSAFHLRTLHSSNGSMSSSAGHDGEAALPGAEATPAEVRLEIASVEAEGRRLVAAFDGLEEAAFREAEGGIGPGGDGGHHGGVIDVSTEGANDWTVLPSPDRPKPLKPALKQPSSSISSPASSQGRRTSYLSQPSLPSPPSTLSHKLSRSINPSSTTTSSLHSRSTSSATNRGRASVDRSFTSSLSRTGEDDDPEAAALEATVMDIRRRKKDTEERYERRLTFLKGKLRAAELKERAMR